MRCGSPRCGSGPHTAWRQSVSIRQSTMYPVSYTHLPLSIPNFEGNERKYVDDAIDQGWVSTGGAYITKLEEQMAEFLHVEKVAACQSGTSALHLSLLECNVQPGDVYKRQVQQYMRTGYD